MTNKIHEVDLIVDRAMEVVEVVMVDVVVVFVVSEINLIKPQRSRIPAFLFKRKSHAN